MKRLPFMSKSLRQRRRAGTLGWMVMYDPLGPINLELSDHSGFQRDLHGGGAGGDAHSAAIPRPGAAGRFAGGSGLGGLSDALGVGPRRRAYAAAGARAGAK